MVQPLQTAPVKRSKHRVWLAAFAVMFVAAGLYVWLVRNSGPSFQDKSLGYWYQQLPVSIVPQSKNWRSTAELTMWPGQIVVGNQVQGQIKEKPDDAVRAIKAMGTNALPFLVSKIQSRKSSFKNRLQLWAHKAGIKARFVDDPQVERGRAITGLLYLRPLPENTLGELRRLGTNSDPAVASSSSIVLLPQSPVLRLPASLPTNTASILVTPAHLESR